MANQMEAHPFLRWPGGKQLLSKRIIQFFPENYSNYYAPFLGGASIFYTITNEIERAYLSDLNSELITTYKQIKNNVDAVIKELKKHEKNHCRSYYYLVRAKHHQECPKQLASRFIYLNKTCFNGLYRVNSKGHFNVAIGLHKNLNICDEDTLKRASKALQKATFKTQSFERIDPLKDSLIYCDPPYHEKFNAYTPQGFCEDQQILLRDKFREWATKEVKAIVSNSNTPFIRKIYRHFNIHEIQNKYRIAGLSRKIPKSSELIITNY